MRQLIITFSIIVLGIVAQEESQSGNPCTDAATCSKCIIADPECAWCSEEEFSSEGNKRCDYRGNLFGKCNVSQIVIPGHKIKKLKDDELSNKGAKEGEAIQLKPQEINLKLRPKSPYMLNVEFRQAEDYPVDLYYLMDLSKSMEDDKDKLATLGDLLSAHMENITRNFRLGFGSFVDKVVMPYVSTVPHKLLEPCTNCAAPYGFLNHMPLSLDTSNFATEVNLARVSGNLDAPEGGFDAIMQAIVCEDIGWRLKSRKMLVFSTDSGFHYAGDGKLGGIVKPNDGVCHLDKDGFYTESIHQDYPSLSQINHKIMEHKVNIIFAVTANQLSTYERLSELLEGSSTGRLENDSSNVVQLVKDQYDKITSGVEMKDDADKTFIEIKYYSTCLGEERKQTNICKGLKVGTSVTFDAEIKVLKCPDDRRKWNQTFQISPVGLNEALTVNLQMICECECEKPWNEEKASDKCSLGNGTYECGICSCYDKKFGRKCECDLLDENQAINETSCKYQNEDRVCSGRGTCHCGICECFKRVNRNEIIDGKFCECDNFSCDRVGNKMCSGPDHGFCKCGNCECINNWTGTACECLNVTDSCIAPGSDLICDGHGICDCGACKCEDKGDERYSGDFCEECYTCPGKCELYKECVQCRVFKSGPLDEKMCAENCTIFPKEVEKVEVKEKDEKRCAFRDDDDCKFYFVYKMLPNNKPYIEVQRTKDCPEPVNILAIVLGVIGGIVAIGLALLLIWKLLTTIHDRREFAKFEKERQMAKWDTGENPIYKQATSTFKNPTYGGKQ